MTTTTLPDVPDGASAAIRLKAAIKDRGYPNVTKFSEANDIPYEALAAHVSGRRALTREKAELYAMALRCPVDWLLYGGHTNGVKMYDTRLPVEYLLRATWSDTAEGCDKSHLPPSIDWPHEIRVPRTELFAAYCGEPIGIALRQGTFIICAKLAAANNAMLPRLGYIVQETRHDMHRILPWFAVGHSGKYVSPADQNKPKRLEPRPQEEGFELLGAIVGFLAIAEGAGHRDREDEE